MSDAVKWYPGEQNGLRYWTAYPGSHTVMYVREVQVGVLFRWSVSDETGVCSDGHADSPEDAQEAACAAYDAL